MARQSKIKYESHRFNAETLQLLQTANEIITRYEDQGYVLTLRQLYYQLVANHGLPNKQAEYKRLGRVIGHGRLSGIVSWRAIEDRTRNLQRNASWSSPKSIIESAAYGYHIDLWENQSARPYVWVEKDALAGVVENTCSPLDVAFLSCRGYTSLSEMWAQAMNMVHDFNMRQQPVVIHLGDHDPSGIDMSRDIEKRLNMFIQEHLPFKSVEFKRIALNMDQINQYNPPPNPAKKTDVRYEGYQEQHGDESWELDALPPEVLDQIIKDAVSEYRDDVMFEMRKRRREDERAALLRVARHWDKVSEALDLYEEINGSLEDEEINGSLEDEE